MRRCQNCLMAETQPGIELNEDELCQACVHFELRDSVDYDERWEQLEEIADKYRGESYYDCVIPVSGGKNSHFQTYVMTEKLDMNPLLVAVSEPFGKTEAGVHNLQNLTEAFDADQITIEIGRNRVKRMMRRAFEERGYPAQPVDLAIYNAPTMVATKMDISLVVHGENVSWEYGGPYYDHVDEESYRMQDYQMHDSEETDYSIWLEQDDISEKDLNLMKGVTPEEVNKAGVEGIYLSYFIPWDGYEHYQLAKKFGFRTVKDEWDREGYIEQYDQIDSLGYRVNGWMKYPKYGYKEVTDVVGYWRRSPHYDISLEEGVELIREHDHAIDERSLDDFLDTLGYSDREFWQIVDEHRNTDLFEEPFATADQPLRPKNDFENIDVA